LTIYLAPVKSPFPGERGQGDRGSELEVCFKNILFLQTESHSFCCGFSYIPRNSKPIMQNKTKTPPP